MSVAKVSNALKGVYSNEGTDAENDADHQDLILDDIITVQKTAADGAAGDTPTLFSFKAPFAFRVVEVTVCPGGALTAHDTNNAVITLAKADGAGGSATTIAVLTTNTASGNWVADTFKNVPVTAANAAVARGQIVTLKKTVGASGVVVPISGYTIKIRRV